MTRRRRKKSRAAYDPVAAGRFWSRRLKSTDPLAAVLTYDAPKPVNEAYDRWETSSLTRLLPKSITGRSALDIGCGIGRLTISMAEAGAEVTALDLSPDMLARCRATARRKRVASRVTTVLGSAHDLAGIEGKFDIVTCFGLLEHLPPRQRNSCLSSAFAHLKRRGRMFVVVNNRNCFFLKGSYPRAKQRPNGYFVSLVGLDWLKKACARKRMSLALKAANPFYAVTHYHVLANSRLLSLSDSELKRLSRLACDLDLAHPLDGPLPDRLASHFMVEIRHR
jgi:2-polyprenyl-3-methyl-5-hydroxy-6-metoxy-1,4-benzoquinol methylase